MDSYLKIVSDIIIISIINFYVIDYFKKIRNERIRNV